MKHGHLSAVMSALVLAAFSSDTVAGVTSNSYEVIVARNVFGLRPILAAEPPTQPVAPPAPRPEIKITGITTLLGAPKALFQYEDKETKSTEFPPLLSEGESYKALTVMSIDADNSRVRIKNGDLELELDFISNGVKPSPRAVTPVLNATPPVAAADRDSRATVNGPAPALPPEILSRLRQKLVEQQVMQTEASQRSGVLP